MAASTANAYAAENRCRWYSSYGMLVSCTIMRYLSRLTTNPCHSVGIVSCIRLASLYELLKSPDLTCKYTTH